MNPSTNDIADILYLPKLVPAIHPKEITEGISSLSYKLWRMQRDITALDKALSWA